MSAGEYCNREVIIVEPTASVSEAAVLMRRHHVGDLVVVEKSAEQTRPVGILTDRDMVIEVMAQQLDPETLLVKDIMSADPVAVPEATSLLDTLELMKQQGVRRVLVTSDNGELQGLMSTDDVIELVAEQLNDLTQLVNRELTREQKQHP